MSKILNVRLEERVLQEMEGLRDPTRYPTQSDFVREAIRRMLREERRSRVREETKRMAQDQDEMARMAELADAGFDDFARRWEQADRGEI